ncbi:1-deoxy-D-xylulose-5-phosphate synthase [Thermaerobacter subterraneus]|uniref:1-deoxy-D-xylulose-5-phosphate synthase n=1 Tax=Thermaerobacter subterraneus DSM 13965 TaxID=867903 RepID=K6QBR4_9FIRM|nr:1-deoxy-D-xylulose-5-phosphate synthase [Thermaerobacter subterraneus]EKP93836.1 1-deoxy-D-xylulose-5-phosphate synthase [Thermaerobacter subterraneus DSM 13965]
MAEILPRLQGPQDLKAMDEAQLTQLAAEIRRVIIDTVARQGGHLGASLGVVELTLALHRVFDSPKDRIIWDTGHQAYPHKLVTGRFHRFATLRQTGGLSGFLKRDESPHDIVEAGHAGTSISHAVGLARARDLRGEKHHVVAVIGDGALTAGMAFEALNHAGHLGTDLLIVLNDNSMSIAPNVGGLARYLTQIRTDPAYERMRAELERVLEQLPRVGSQAVRWLQRFKDSLKYLVVPGMLFEALGFRYIGPVDGYRLRDLIRVLESTRSMRGPVLVHVITQKGKGYAPAEGDPWTWHGPRPFNPATGKMEPARPGEPPSYTSVFARTLVELARNEPRLVAITAAMPDGTGVATFARAFPERAFDVGIAEQHAVTFAAGLALGGLRPVVAIYSTFLQRAFDQVVHDVGLQRLPVIFAIDRAGIVGADGETHQGLYDIAYLRPLPGFVLMAPRDENELQHMLKTAVAYEAGPVAIRWPRGSGVGVPLEEPRVLPIGRAELLRSGRDVALIAYGPLAHAALKAAGQLAQEGIQAAVVNARFAKPLDEALLCDLLATTRCAVTIEEHVLAGGFGSAVLEMAARHGLDARIRCLGVPDRVVEHGDPAHFRTLFGLTPEGIARAARELVGAAAPRRRRAGG